MPTAAFRLSGGASVPVAYTESRGVLVSARVGGRNMRAAVDTLATFRDGTGRRMPAILAAAAIALGTNRASAHATTPSGTELQIRHVVDAESGKDTEYAAMHHGLEYTYAVRETMLDRLFAKVVPSGACPGALFEGNEEIRSGWLSTHHIHLFWAAVVAHIKARVICVDAAAHNFSSDPTAYTRMALGLGKSIGKMQGDEQVWLFPINISNAHHTFARVVYQRSTGSVVLTHYDSLNANVRCEPHVRLHHARVPTRAPARTDPPPQRRGAAARRRRQLRTVRVHRPAARVARQGAPIPEAGGQRRGHPQSEVHSRDRAGQVEGAAGIRRGAEDSGDQRRRSIDLRRLDH
jgi:hypothetical protein